MGQFLVGLFAGIVVGLVMEWVIDLTGLFSRRPVSKQKIQKHARSNSSSSPSNSETGVE